MRGLYLRNVSLNNGCISNLTKETALDLGIHAESVLHLSPVALFLDRGPYQSCRTITLLSGKTTSAGRQPHAIAHSCHE